MKTTRGPQPLGSIYRRIDDDYPRPAELAARTRCSASPGLFDVYRAGGLCLLNAIGNGVADDKSVYPYVPEMIRYYLGEEPIIPNVPDVPRMPTRRRASTSWRTCATSS